MNVLCVSDFHCRLVVGNKQILTFPDSIKHVRTGLKVCINAKMNSMNIVFYLKEHSNHPNRRDMRNKQIILFFDDVVKVETLIIVSKTMCYLMDRFSKFSLQNQAWHNLKFETVLSLNFLKFSMSCFCKNHEKLFFPSSTANQLRVVSTNSMRYMFKNILVIFVFN